MTSSSLRRCPRGNRAWGMRIITTQRPRIAPARTRQRPLCIGRPRVARSPHQSGELVQAEGNPVPETRPRAHPRVRSRRPPPHRARYSAGGRDGIVRTGEVGSPTTNVCAPHGSRTSCLPLDAVCVSSFSPQRLHNKHPFRGIPIIVLSPHQKKMPANKRQLWRGGNGGDMGQNPPKTSK